jgi:hypothetical protein
MPIASRRQTTRQVRRRGNIDPQQTAQLVDEIDSRTTLGNIAAVNQHVASRAERAPPGQQRFTISAEGVRVESGVAQL